MREKGIRGYDKRVFAFDQARRRGDPPRKHAALDRRKWFFPFREYRVLLGKGALVKQKSKAKKTGQSKRPGG